MRNLSLSQLTRELEVPASSHQSRRRRQARGAGPAAASGWFALTGVEITSGKSSERVRTLVSSSARFREAVGGQDGVGAVSERGLVRRRGLEDELTQVEVSMYESGHRLPGLRSLREYARLAGV